TGAGMQGPVSQRGQRDLADAAGSEVGGNGDEEPDLEDALGAQHAPQGRPVGGRGVLVSRGLVRGWLTLGELIAVSNDGGLSDGGGPADVADAEQGERGDRERGGVERERGGGAEYRDERAADGGANEGGELCAARCQRVAGLQVVGGQQGRD